MYIQFMSCAQGAVTLLVAMLTFLMRFLAIYLKLFLKKQKTENLLRSEKARLRKCKKFVMGLLK